jgi:hypothetical protein
MVVVCLIGPLNNLQEFDQTEFFKGIDGEIAMADKGLIYIPKGCGARSQRKFGFLSRRKCYLHFSFHGCSGKAVKKKEMNYLFLMRRKVNSYDDLWPVTFFAVFCRYYCL